MGMKFFVGKAESRIVLCGHAERIEQGWYGLLIQFYLFSVSAARARLLGLIGVNVVRCGIWQYEAGVCSYLGMECRDTLQHCVLCI